MVDRVLFSVLEFICIFHGYLAVPIDNGVKGFPHVTCGVQSLKVDIDTEKVFQGKVFIKGESGKKECVRSFAQGPLAPLAPVDSTPYGTQIVRGETVGIELGFGHCNMRRQRTLVPRGVEYSFTLVISFHSLFITKVDKAFRIRCFYMETEKTVTQHLDVSMLNTHVVNEQFLMPQCRYHIRRGERNGPPLRFARVGEPVYHLWECDAPASVLYGMLVKSCFVDDGQGNKVELIDDKGCANDRHLIPNLTYNSELLETFTESHVFKYADKPSLFFACTIVICFKEDGGCNGITPPNCGTNALASLLPLFPAEPAPIVLPMAPVVYPAIPAEPPTTARFPLPPYFHDFPLSWDDNINVTKKAGYFESTGNASTTNAITGPYFRPISKLRRHKREIKELIKKSFVVETDLSAQPFVVLPFDEDSNPDSQDIELNEIISSQPKLNQTTTSSRSAFIWSSSNAFATSGHCISSTGFMMILALIFLLLVFSASMTILFFRNHSKMHEKTLLY